MIRSSPLAVLGRENTRSMCPPSQYGHATGGMSRFLSPDTCTICCRTTITRRAKSTSSHRSPHASPRRRPVPAITSKRAPRRCVPMWSRKAPSSAGSHGMTLGR
ncbi:hypothetical protein LK08_29950 [Streptomyces sp. MUSC 125]|nr:hypothetical protein LK08_29950 [Streptomyces sp. MUSC 125]